MPNKTFFPVCLFYKYPESNENSGEQFLERVHLLGQSTFNSAELLCLRRCVNVYVVS